MARRTARQIAASRRNIVLAQKRSAQLRRGGAGKHGSKSFYGKGRAGRKAAKHSTYGKKKDGLSIAQQQRRKQRSNRRKRVAGAAISGAVIAVQAYAIYKKNPDMQRSVKTAQNRAKSTANRAKGTYKINRMTGSSRATSAKRAAKSTKRKNK